MADVMPNSLELLQDPEDLLTRFTLSTSNLFASPPLPVANFLSLTLNPHTSTYSFAAAFPDDSTIASYCLGAPGSDSTATPAFIDIPSKNAERHILLTPTLASASLIVTEHNGATYRVYHDARRHASILYDNVVMAIDTDSPTTVLMQFDSSGTWFAYVKQDTTVSVVKPGSYDRSAQMNSVLQTRDRLQEQVLQLAADVAVDTTSAEGVYQPGVPAAQNEGTRRWREMREAVRVVNDRGKAPMARAQRELHRRLQHADPSEGPEKDPKIEALYSYLDQWFRANTRKFDVVLKESSAADAIWMWLKEKEAGGVAMGLELDVRRDLMGRVTERYAAVEMDCLRRPNTSMAYGFSDPGESQFVGRLIESKQRFLQRGIPYNQRGELIRHIGELARQEFEELQRRALDLTTDFERIGGALTGVPQDLFLRDAGDKFGARCFPFVQAMAVAQSTGGFGIDALVEKMFAAVAHPEYADSVLFRQALQNLNGNPEAVRASTVLGRFNIDDVMRRIRPDTSGVVKVYTLNTPTHSMLIAVSTIANDASWVFYDPNIALVTFPSESGLVIALGMQLLGRGFAEIYNAITSGGGPVFDLCQLDLGALAQVSVGYHLTLTNLTVPRTLTESIRVATSPSLVLPVSEQQKRDLETATAIELVGANNWASRWRDCVTRIKLESNLGPYWVPVLATLREQPDAIAIGYLIQFINQQNLDETRWVETDEEDIWAFTQFVDGHLEKMRNSLTTEGGALRPRKGVPDVDAVDGLNSGFLIQALIGWSSGTDDPWGPGTDSPLSTALTIHAYMNMTQMVFSGITDLSKTITIVKTMMRSEEAAQASVSAFSKTLGRAAGSVGEGIGILFGVFTVGLDITELVLAGDAIDIAVFGTQLVFDYASLVVGVGSIGAGLVGAAGASAILGGVGVIFSGLAVGFGALAAAFGEVAKDAQKVGIYFDTVDKAYNNGGYTYETEDGGILKPIPYAVIKKVDLTNGRVDFDSQYIYRTKHGHTGSGESNYIGWIGDAPVMVVDRAQAINVREGIGKGDHSLAANYDGYTAIVLPCTPKSYIKYAWQILPGATTRYDTGFDIIRRLEKDYRFDYDFYVFPIEKTIRSITQEYVATPVTIVLPSRPIRLEVPELPQEMHGQLSYTLEGNGGVYTVGLHKGSKVTLSVAPGGLRSIQWVLDTQNLGTAAVAQIVAGGLLIGGVTVSIDQYGGDFRILILGAHGLLSEVNFTDNTISPIVEDATQFTGRPELMSELAQHLHDLSAAHTLHSEFVVVNHYEVPTIASAGATIEKVGRAYFDVQWDRFLYTCPTPTSLSVVTDAELAAIIGNDVYFYNTNTASLWRVKKPHPGSTAWDHGDRGCLAEYCPLFPNKNLRLRHVWHESDIIFATYSLERESAQLGQLIYAIDRDRMCLVTIVGYTSMIPGLAEMQHLDQDTLLSLMAVMYNDAPELPNSLGGTLVRAQHDAELITVYGPDEFGVFNRFWLRKKDNAVIRAILHDNPIPEDLVFPGSLISTETGKEVFFFYFKGHPGIYRQTGPGAGSAQAEACQVPAAFGTLVNLFNADGELFVSTSDGYILRLTAAGMFFLEGITRLWFEKHSTPLWTYALAQVAEEATATTLTVLGVQDGDVHIPVWYHHGCTVIASGILRGKKLQPLGLDGSGGAWVCDWETPQSGQLYLQPLIRNDDLRELFHENGWTCCEPDRIPVAEPVLGDHRVRSFAVVKDGLQITTVDGIVLVLGEGGSINLVAVNEDWQLAHRDNLVSSMSLLLERWLHSEVVIFHGPPTAIASWYHVARQEVLHVDPVTWATNPVWLGMTPVAGVGLVSLLSSGDMYRASVRGGTKIGSYTLATRCGKTLVLNHPRDNVINLPLLVGADAIFLTAQTTKNTYVISEPVWAKYRTIVIDNPGEKEAPVIVKFALPDVAGFMTSNVHGDLVLLDMVNGNTLTVKGALGERMQSNGILIDTGVGMVGTGEIRDAQNITANFLGVATAPDITLAYVMSKRNM